MGDGVDGAGRGVQLAPTRPIGPPGTPGPAPQRDSCPAEIAATFNSSGSTPQTSWPLAARQAAETVPT